MHKQSKSPIKWYARCLALLALVNYLASSGLAGATILRIEEDGDTFVEETGEALQESQAGAPVLPLQKLYSICRDSNGERFMLVAITNGTVLDRGGYDTFSAPACTLSPLSAAPQLREMTARSMPPAATLPIRNSVLAYLRTVSLLC